MILFELTGDEAHPVYQTLAISNGDRQYDFLSSIVNAARSINKTFLSQSVIKSLNFHAITCLHTNAGEYRPCEVTVGTHIPPAHYRVQALMDDFVNEVNRHWVELDAVVLASYVLWRLNYIHPFINGNGRTARAACYFVLCLKLGGIIGGSPILPELIVKNRPEYVSIMQQIDQDFVSGNLNLQPLHSFLSRLLQEQIQSADNSQ